LDIFFLAPGRALNSRAQQSCAYREFGAVNEEKMCLHIFTNERRSEAPSRPHKTSTPRPCSVLQ
jgi:hypothetical protein